MERPVEESTAVVMAALITLVAVEMERSEYIQEILRVKLISKIECWRG